VVLLESVAQAYTLKGYAYNGGGRRITRVDLSFDDGKVCPGVYLKAHHAPCEDSRMSSALSMTRPHTMRAHSEREADEVATLLLLADVGADGAERGGVPDGVRALLGVAALGAECGRGEAAGGAGHGGPRAARDMVVRAWDDSQNCQPRDLTWNVMGMMNGSWYRVKTSTQRQAGGQIAVSFTHPCRAGALNGGWMAPVADDAMSAARSSGESNPNESPSREEKTFTREEVAAHNKRDDCWIIWQSGVYNVASYVAEHPGGASSILLNAGEDVTDELAAIHSPTAKKMLAKFKIGVLALASQLQSPPASSPEVEPAGAAAHSHTEVAVPAVRRVCRLEVRVEVNHNTRIFTFAVPTKDCSLGLAVGQHVRMHAVVGGKAVARAYTPISRAEQPGSFDLLVKVYRRDEHPQFPEGGVFSQHLDSLSIGDELEVEAPIGHFVYHGLGRLQLGPAPPPGEALRRHRRRHGHHAHLPDHPRRPRQGGGGRGPHPRVARLRQPEHGRHPPS
jgi:cytochrome b involved in lipid metabolism